MITETISSAELMTFGEMNYWIDRKAAQIAFVKLVKLYYDFAG